MERKIMSKGNIIKETNYKKILQLVCSGEELTKLDIAYTLKISIPTVTTNINELKEAGIIDEVESDIYTGGRKPKIIKLFPNSRVSIGVSITKYRVSIVVMNLLNEILVSKEQSYSADYFMEYIKVGKELIDTIIEELELEDENILGIGISIPGTINEKYGIAEHTNMGYKDIQLGEIYKIFKHSVYIENEANLSLVAEKKIGGYENLKDLIYIGINEGLGGGIFVNGELFKGVNGQAGEFGRMRIAPTEVGQEEKHVEDYMSTNSLIQRYNEKANQIITEFEQFEERVKEKDEFALEVLSQGVDILLMTIYNLAMILDIRKIIIGGKVGRLIKSQNIAIDEKLKFDMDISMSDIKNTTTIGASLLPLIDFYKIVSENE